MDTPDQEHGTDLPSDDDLAQAVTHVQLRLGGQVRELRLDVRDQGLVLRGQARSYYAKQLAQQTVMKMLRLRIVANEIKVP